MDAIFTHENADFDALAALLGAKKIYPAARAVLPRRLNRNVRDFLALYADALPFTRQEELARKTLRDVLAVDTQTIPSARGVDKNTRVHFIDHHPLARALKPQHSFASGDAGATTTLFVEEIREKDLPLTPIEATLLLLGIYEDTGSLLYGTTKPRDAHAAAFLLDHGANLDIVREFLHHPLTDAQRALYPELLEHTESLQMAGHAVAISAARAGKYVEEISTLAHQLRELYDPAALFVLVQMEDHIQLVARSDRDAIDVAQIARAFGGGGHARAAAALIRGQTLKQVKTKLTKLLHTNVRPSVTVRQLMSTGAQTLEPDATFSQAADMMHRYGHEGFPVVRRGKLVGVLTRREIDRALHHHLGSAAIKTLMHKPIAVSPDDSLEKLRAVMIESDLGQVPVVDNGRILGIVTRTDLIKESAEGRAMRERNLSERLGKNLPPPLLRLLRGASETAHELGSSLYVVGGFVRDLLLDEPNLDLDLVVEGDAIALAQVLQQKFGGRIHTHARFGTANWLLKETKDERGKMTDALPSFLSPLSSLISPLPSLDFATARREFYAHPSALPQVERSSIKQDLHRRDFTINALAICLDPDRFGQLLDPFGGKADLQRGWVRVLHNLSFIEDPTRILRAVRFEQRLGFAIEARTAELIGNALEMLPRISGERLRGELTLIFQEHDPAKAMTRLSELGVLQTIFPPLKFTAWHAAKFRRVADGRALMFWGVLAFEFNAAEIEEFVKRLRLSNAERETLLQVCDLRGNEPALAAETLAPSALAHQLENYSDDALAIYALATDSPRVAERIELYRTRLRHIAPELTGDDLKQRGIPPSPQYRAILTRLRDARLDGQIATRAEEEEIVRRIVG